MIARCSACARGRVGRVGGAVVEPRVDVEGHVDHVDPDIARVGERVDNRVEEEVAGVLAALELDQRDLRCYAGDAGAVRGRADRAGHVGAVPAVVGTDRIETARHLTGAVDIGQVSGEVAGQPEAEVRGDVGVGGVEAGVEHPDSHAALARLDLAGLVGPHHLQAPQLVVQRVQPGHATVMRPPAQSGLWPFHRRLGVGPADRTSWAGADQS